MFHKPVRRTFNREAKGGLVTCDRRRWLVTNRHGKPHSGPVRMYINRTQPFAECSIDFERLTISEVRE